MFFRWKARAEPGFKLIKPQLALNQYHFNLVYVARPKFCDTVSFSGHVLCEIKELWRVALLISILSYPQVGSFSQDELHRRKEKYLRVERFITDLGK
jgi:hypothetical protein